MRTTDRLLTSEFNMQAEAEIFALEQALRLDTPEKLALEATLLVDQDFLRTAAITGEPAAPERFFGNDRWLGHLQARLYAQAYGCQPLTVDFIVQLHRCFLDAAGMHDQASFVDSENPRGGRFQDGQFAPITATDEQLDALAGKNKWITWLPAKGPAAAGPNVGYIGYLVKSKQDRIDELEKLCQDYNNSYNDPNFDPYRRAALLQQIFISLHPLAIDFNGSVSRILLNWSLMNDGIGPCALSNFDADLFRNPNAWTREVRAGVTRYQAYQCRLQSAATPAAMLGVQGLVDLYTRMRCQAHPLTPAVPIADADGIHDREQHKRFLAELHYLTTHPRTINPPVL